MKGSSGSPLPKVGSLRRRPDRGGSPRHLFFRAGLTKKNKKLLKINHPFFLENLGVMVVNYVGKAGFHPKIPLKKFNICPNR
jgi:hypothetical protein